MTEFLMPSLGADMEAATLVAWLKQAGDSVVRGDVIAEVDTDKGVIEIEVFESGVIERLLVPEGVKVPVGTPLCIVSAAPHTSAPTPPEPPPPQAPTVNVPAPPAVPPVVVSETPAATSTPGTRLRVSPSARRTARELGVDVSRATGTGRHGAITRDDILALAGSSAPSADPAARMRQAIAAAMSRSNREIPHYYVTHTVDVSQTLEWLERTNEGRPPAERVLLAAVVLRAVARACRTHPEMNARFENEQLELMADVNVAMAIRLRSGGLVIPAVLSADRLSLEALMRALRDVVERARRGQLRSSELTSGTITMTSLGERGVESVFGVIYPPQTAIVGVGTPSRRPWVVGDVVQPRTLIALSLGADHRASDGLRGASFLAAVARGITEPESP